jgi:predicted dehydrogenase
MGLDKTQLRASKLRLAVVGCGAIAEQGHLPAALQVQEVLVTALVDKNKTRANDLARQFGVGTATCSLDGIEKLSDAVILCLPHHLHCPMALDLMQRGMHVLVEKPMALNTAECDQMIAAAEKARVVLAVGLMRRYFRCALYLKQILASGVMGAVERFHIEDGGSYAWPSASPFILSKAHSGGGVLMGNGSHVMDSLIWWFGEPAEIQCRTNAAGGMETDAHVEIVLPDGAQGVVELSRTRSLANRIHVWAERGTVQIPLYGDHASLSLRGNDFSLSGRANLVATPSAREQDLPSVMADQLRAWTRAIGGQPSAIVTGSESRRSIALIEACYQIAKPLPEPWAVPLILA